jgi:two-component system chemotaxis response regulator CheB
MAVRVLIVDDSGFFRRRLTEMLSSDPRINVVGTAVDGRDAIAKTQELKPDVITMDIEMPVMDGISAVRKIMAIQPTPVLVFSSLSHEGAQSTFDALEAGALDYLPKNFDDISNNREEVARVLRSRVWSIGIRGLPGSASASAGRVQVGKPAPRAETKPVFTPSPAPVGVNKAKKGDYRLVAIGTSTGGPVALQEVLTALPQNFPLPLLLMQHMPESFTGAFAKRLDQLCKIRVVEASDGDALEPGVALLAPGGKQMVLESRGDMMRVRIQESEPGQNYKPCVDVTFSSIARAVPGKTLAIVLTGMGSDGKEGARLLSQGGATIWAQDEQSCVIYGMPMAIAQAGIADQILPLSEVSSQLLANV